MGECILAGHPQGKGGGKRTARLIVGTVTAGWTSKDCDYLCDGTDDQAEINAAIQALPAGGGEVLVLDGTYNIRATISLNKAKIKLVGNGNATVLVRMWDSLANAPDGVIDVTAGECIITNVCVDGNKTNFSKTANNHDISVKSSNNIISGNMCVNGEGSGVHIHAFIANQASNFNVIEGNICIKNRDGISLYSSMSNSIAGNVCTNNSGGISISGGSKNNTITGNSTNGNNLGIYVIQSSNNCIAGNLCSDHTYNDGIGMIEVSNCTVSGNTCVDNRIGIHLQRSSNNTIVGNTCICGTGTSSDYPGGRQTINLEGTGNNNNLVAYNNIMGKNYTDGGTGNTFTGNKYN